MIDIETWFTHCQKQLSVEIKRISVAESKHWKITTDNANPSCIIHHDTNRLHKITFLTAWDPPRQEWVDRCLLEPIPEGKENNHAIILLAKHQNKYLIQAKAEPGNNTPHRVAITTTVQTSYTNIFMGFSGKIPFIELYDDSKCKKLSIIQDGAQLLNKVNEVCFIELKNASENIPKMYYWSTLEEIEAFAKKNLVSEHLMQALGMIALYTTEKKPVVRP